MSEQARRVPDWRKEKRWTIVELIGAENIKKRWQELHRRAVQKKIFTYLEPDIVECEVKWALGSITMNKASGGNGIPLSYIKS